MRDRRKRNILIGSLFAVLIFMGIGYAVVSQILNISGVSSVNGKWNIYIASITPAASGSGSSVREEIALDKLAATFEAELMKPGDEVEYTVVVKNGGNIAARLEAVTPTITNSHEYVTFTNDLETGYILGAGESMSFKVNTSFVTTVTDLDENLTIRPIYDLILNFTQYDSDNPSGGGGGGGTPTRNILAQGDASYESGVDNVQWAYYDDGSLELTGTGRMKNLGYERSVLPSNPNSTDFYDYYLTQQIVAQILYEKLNSDTDPNNNITYSDLFDDGSSYYSLVEPYNYLIYAFQSDAYIDKTFGAQLAQIGVEFTNWADIISQYGAAAFGLSQSDINFIVEHVDDIPPITNITISDGITSLSSHTFSEFGYNGSIVIPNSITTIPNNCFLSNAITSITFPSNLTTIGSSAFENNSLTSVVIPSTVTSISGSVFENNNLTNVTVQGTYQIPNPGTFSNPYFETSSFKCNPNLTAAGFTFQNTNLSINNIDTSLFTTCDEE